MPDILSATIKMLHKVETQKAEQGLTQKDFSLFSHKDNILMRVFKEKMVALMKRNWDCSNFILDLIILCHPTM